MQDCWDSAGSCHLNLSGSKTLARGEERLAGVLNQCTALAHLDLYGNYIGAGGAERFAGVLGQCTALAHLNLCDNDISAAGAEILYVFLTTSETQCGPF